MARASACSHAARALFEILLPPHPPFRFYWGCAKIVVSVGWLVLKLFSLPDALHRNEEAVEKAASHCSFGTGSQKHVHACLRSDSSITCRCLKFPPTRPKWGRGRAELICCPRAADWAYSTDCRQVGNLLACETIERMLY